MKTATQSQPYQFVTANHVTIQVQGNLNSKDPIKIIEAANRGEVKLTALARKEGDFSTINENGEIVSLNVYPKAGIEKPTTILAAIEMANEGKVDIVVSS